ncbi:adenine nucleotide alpha hydrolases-like protein [Decorospora gaudefroyi]|uniref:Adenine nucleotide alpha hydrolases-like protein n=1 Tax=Decorospora gaudefroyi TaxID=184978 RepID=A0A6A5KBR1_9PLEO|nr:adenine nucleotide alpha hydrolases-like protein [Decorospora gaudefroyi]
MSASPTSKQGQPASPAVPTSPASYAVSPLQLPTSGLLTPDEARRPSIQFLAHRNTSLPRGTPRPRERRRLSSPPPPPVFQPRVSFDTFDKPADFIEESSFTLIAKHKDYEYTKRSRTFLCGFDENEYSVYALQWLINELVDDGDEIVCLRVVEKEDAIAGDRSVETGRYRVEAEHTMADIQSRNHDNKAINLILEFSIGKVQKVIDDMINLYEPAILVVGTRGKSLGGFQGLLPGSVSKYCLQHSPVPVIVVRPTSKRDKAKSKRTNDPDRQGYREILAKSEKLPEIDSPRNSFFANEAEAATVGAGAAATAPKLVVEAHPLAQVEHAEDGDDDDDDLETGDSMLGDDIRSPGPMMKSPQLQNLDSPELSSQSSSEDEEDQGGVAMNTGTSAVNEVVREGENLNVGEGEKSAKPNSMSNDDSNSLLPVAQAADSSKSDDASPAQKSSEGT